MVEKFSEDTFIKIMMNEVLYCHSNMAPLPLHWFPSSQIRKRLRNGAEGQFILTFKNDKISFKDDNWPGPK